MLYFPCLSLHFSLSSFLIFICSQRSAWSFIYRIIFFPYVSSTGSSNSEKPSAGKNSSQGLNGPSDSHLRIVQDTDSSGLIRKEVSEEKRVTFSSVASRVQAGKANNARSQSVTVASSSSAIGVYSSSTDPVHVPSPDSRSPGSVGAIKREVGVVGLRRQTSDNSKSSLPSSSFSNSLLGGEGSGEALQSFTTISKNDQVNQASESIIPSLSISKSLTSSHYSTRQQHQQPVGHQKGELKKCQYEQSMGLCKDKLSERNPC